MGTAVLQVTTPAGETAVHQLDGPSSVGRRSAGGLPDVVLEPDPQRWVSRLHLTLERRAGQWWAVDLGSRNGTLLHRGGSTVRLTERERLRHGDTLLVLGGHDRGGEPEYWRLVLLDPEDTSPAPERGPSTIPTAGLRYDWVAARAYRRDGDSERLLDGLRPQGHQLIRYMLAHSGDGEAVACSHADLIVALWGDPSGWPPHRSYTRGDLAGVVRTVRRCIEDDPSEPQLLQTVSRFGYRLAVYRPHACDS